MWHFLDINQSKSKFKLGFCIPGDKHCIFWLDKYLKKMLYWLKNLLANWTKSAAEVSWHCQWSKVAVMNGTKHLLRRPLNCQKYSTVCSQLSLNGHLIKADTSLKWTRGVGPCCTSVIHLPPRGTPLQGGQSELVTSVSALEGVDCASIIQDCSCCIHDMWFIHEVLHRVSSLPADALPATY